MREMKIQKPTPFLTQGKSLNLSNPQFHLLGKLPGAVLKRCVSELVYYTLHLLIENTRTG